MKAMHESDTASNLDLDQRVSYAHFFFEMQHGSSPDKEEICVVGERESQSESVRPRFFGS